MEKPWLRLLSLGALAITFLGGLGLMFSNRTNYCEMTYMFEYPKFVHIKVPGNEFYPQYSLYSYSEGRLTEKARKMRFDGIPVLYLPGNSGSRSQARSLASVALRMAYSNDHDCHFDYYTVSFNEELSGIYGGVLETQTMFAAIAMKKVLSLYQSNKKGNPKAVILIGHSMGGVIAKRLLVHPEFENMTNIVVTLAAPLVAPVLNIDTEMDKYYLSMEREWQESVTKDNKVLMSFGGGFRDFMVPSNLIASNDSDFSALMTAIPGVWVSTDHLSIVWCRQFMIAFNKFLFSIVDRWTMQISEDKRLILAKARQYFQANRSTTISEEEKLQPVRLNQDAFWYEDNRRVFQISRPNVARMTYLMIRLTGIHLDRFVAIETIGHREKDWLFGCTAAYTDGNQRTCTRGESLSSMVRWTPAAQGQGRRKLATAHLHDIMLRRPEWTHVLVRIPPTRDPVKVNIDINDLSTRNVTVDLSWNFSFGKTVVKKETERGAIYYELLLPGLTQLHHAYLLYVEPTLSCGAVEYHASAEMHVPWAKNQEYYHFFTQLTKKPMKLQLFTSSPHILSNSAPNEHVKVTLLLDPQCTFAISIAPSRYHSLIQLLRHHSPVLFPYMAAILLMATRSSLLSLKTGGCQSIHSALAGASLRPYFTVVLGCVGSMALTKQPLLAHLLETSSMHNTELLHVGRSVISVGLYMAALGAVNVLAAAALAAVVFCSQLAHRLVLRLVWRGGGGGLADKLASVLRRVPALVSAALVCAAPASCGAAALAAGAAFYAFSLSKMYEDYLEDYAYKLLAKIGARIRRYFKTRRHTHTSEDTQLVPTSSTDGNTNEVSNIREKMDDEIKCIENTPSDKNRDMKIVSEDKKDQRTKATESMREVTTNENEDKQLLPTNERSEQSIPVKEILIENEVEIDEELSGLHFHFIMFFLWMVVAIANVPALLTWARNFKYSMVLRPDTSFIPGAVMSVCAGFLWQIGSPRRNLKHYDTLSQIIYATAIVIIVMGPLANYYIGYLVTIVFTLITIQQLFDTELLNEVQNISHQDNIPSDPSDLPSTFKCDSTEKRMFETLKNMREKTDFTDDTDLN